MTDVDAEIAAFVRHLNDADPRHTKHTQAILVDNQTTRADTHRRRLAVVILQSAVAVAIRCKTKTNV